MFNQEGDNGQCQYPAVLGVSALKLLLRSSCCISVICPATRLFENKNVQFFVRLPFRTSSAIINFLGTEDPPHVVNLAAEKWSRGVEDIVPKRATKKCKVRLIFSG
jgi:hypothetical protein